jgi:5-methyltetrahydrofolate--homocysteine methyltransferase
MSEQLFAQLARCLYEGDADGVVKLTEQAMHQGLGATEILNRGLVAGMEEVGRDFQSGELFIPELIVAARAMHAGIDLLKPRLTETAAEDRGKIVLGTVKGDMHDIGKKLVGVMMQGTGFTVVDLGKDVAPERFVEAVRAERPQLVGMSALLSTTMPMIKATVDLLAAEEFRTQVKILAGGAPVTQAWAEEIGADGYAEDAVGAVQVARDLLDAEGGTSHD